MEPGVRRPIRPTLPAAILLWTALLCSGILAPRPVAADTLPFSVTLEAVPITGEPHPLQSSTLGVSGGKWLLLGGRTAGLHAFTQPHNFPEDTFNHFAYVLDPVAGKFVGQPFDLRTLGNVLGDSLSATNAESVQVGDTLYIVGGYGVYNNVFVTFSTVTTLNVKQMIQLIVSGKATPASVKRLIHQNQDERLRVAGGGLDYIAPSEGGKGVFYLVFGQILEGEYSVDPSNYNANGGFHQEYTQQVRVFTLEGNLAITNGSYHLAAPYSSDLPYNRRDLNVIPEIRPTGKQGVNVYGGVFRAGQIAGNLTPITIDPATDADGGPTATVVVDTYLQPLNHYECAVLPLFDPHSKAMYVTFFGGISQYHYDRATNTLIRDPVNLSQGLDGLPFIPTVTTLVHSPGDKYQQYIQPTDLPGLEGTEARFGPAAGAPVFSNGVINFGRIKKATTVGYIYGGIIAQAPYSAQGPTTPSDKLYKVVITPGASTVTPTPPLPGGN